MKEEDGFDDLSMKLNSLSLCEVSFLGLFKVEVEEWDFTEKDWFLVAPETHRSPDADQREYRIEETEEGDFCKVNTSLSAADSTRACILILFVAAGEGHRQRGGDA